MTYRVMLLCALLLAASALLRSAVQSEAVPVRDPLAHLPLRVGAWQGEDAPVMDSRVVAVLGVDDFANRIYYRPGGSVASLYVGYYQSQRQGDTMHSPLNCLPGAGWSPMQRRYLAIPVKTVEASPGGERIPREIIINRIVIQKGMEKQLVLYWYQSHGRVVASEYWGKIYTVLDALRTRRTDAALVRVIVPVQSTGGRAEDDAEAAGVDFVQSLFPLLQRHLPN